MELPSPARTLTLVNQLLAALLLSLAVASLVHFGEFLLDTWEGSYLVPFAFLTAIESAYSLHLSRRMEAWSRERILLHVAEWVVILATLKLTSYSGRGLAALRADLPLWRTDFTNTFFDSQFFISVCIIGFVWLLALMMANDLSRLEVDEKTLDEEVVSSIFEDRAVARRDLSYLILTIGASMVVLLAFQSLDLSTMRSPVAPPVSSVAAILLYFILALVMLSLTQLSMLRIQWTIARIPVASQIASRWILYAASFLILTGLVALLLPTRYSIGLLDILRMLISIIASVLTLIMFLVMMPFVLLFGWLASLLDRPAPRLPIDPQHLLPRQPGLLPAGGPEWVEWLKSLLFWLVFLTILGFALYQYLKDRRELLDRLARLPLLRGLFRLVGMLRVWWTGISENVSSAIQAGRQRLRSRIPGDTPNPWRFTSLRRLTPRQRVLFYYLAMVRRGAENGLPRHPSQTPREYSAGLEARLPEVEANIHELTAEFVEARYSLHEKQPQDARRVQRQWERIRQAFRRTFRPTRGA